MILGREYIKIQYRRTSIINYIIFGVSVISCIFCGLVLHKGLVTILGVAIVYLVISSLINRSNVWYQLYKLILFNSYDIEKCLLISYNEVDNTCTVEKDGVEYVCFAYPYTKNYIDRYVNVLYKKGDFEGSIKLAYPH